jgi:hypothetical protein
MSIYVYLELSHESPLYNKHILIKNNGRKGGGGSGIYVLHKCQSDGRGGKIGDVSDDVG